MTDPQYKGSLGLLFQARQFVQLRWYAWSTDALGAAYGQIFYGRVRRSAPALLFPTFSITRLGRVAC